MTDSEYKTFKKYLNSKESPSLKMCIRVMIILGIRVGDCICLKRENFSNDWKELNYTMRKTKKPQPRLIPPVLQKELTAYFRKYNRRMREGFLFFPSWRNQSRNSHIQRSTVDMFFCNMRRTTGLKQVYYICKDGKKLHRISPHTLRHYAAWRYYKASGHDIRAVQYLLGHADIRTTARYIHAMKEASRELEIVEKASIGI